MSLRSVLILLLSMLTTFCSTVSLRCFLRKILFDVSSVLAMKVKTWEPTLRFDGDGLLWFICYFACIVTLWLT